MCPFVASVCCCGQGQKLTGAPSNIRNHFNIFTLIFFRQSIFFSHSFFLVVDGLNWSLFHFLKVTMTVGLSFLFFMTKSGGRNPPLLTSSLISVELFVKGGEPFSLHVDHKAAPSLLLTISLFYVMKVMISPSFILFLHSASHSLGFSGCHFQSFFSSHPFPLLTLSELSIAASFARFPCSP